MPPAWTGPALACAAYLLGSILPAELFARRRGIDLRTEGSGNPGATNAGRILGKGVGRAILVLDVLKGLLPVGVAALWLGPRDPWTAATGIAAVAGHVLPVWHRLRGGKGAATAAGAMLAAVPAAGAAAVATYVALKKLGGRASVGSLGGAFAGAAVTAALERASPPTAMATGIFVIVVARHADNLRRLLRGQEPPS